MKSFILRETIAVMNLWQGKRVMFEVNINKINQISLGFLSAEGLENINGSLYVKLLF